MSDNIEVFIPILSPVVLESRAKSPAGAAGGLRQAAYAELLQSFDADAAKSLRDVMGDLDLSKFSGAAQEDMTMAVRHLREGAVSRLPPGERETGSRFAVLTADWRDFVAGTLVHVQTSSSATVAFLVSGTRVQPAGGRVLLRRSTISLQPPKRLLKATPEEDVPVLKTTRAVLNLAAMAAPPGVGSGILKGGLALFDMIVGTGPSDVEVILAELKTAITAAVAELEGFIATDKIKEVNAMMKAAIQWLADTAGDIKRAKTLPQQIANAHTALDGMKPDYLREFRAALLYLSEVGDLKDKGADVRVRTRAARVFALGAPALFTMDRLQIQLHAFLAVHAVDDREDTVSHRDRIPKAYGDMQKDILGVERDVTSGYTGEMVDRSFVLLYQQMLTTLIRDRLACVTGIVPYPGFGVAFDDGYRATPSQFLRYGELVDKLRASSVVQRQIVDLPGTFNDRVRQASYLPNMICMEYLKDEHLFEYREALDKFINTLAGWGRALNDLNKLLPDAATATVTPARAAS